VFKLTATDASARLARMGEKYTRFLERQDFDVGLYRPERVDEQTPHARDEIYIIAGGTGAFHCSGEKESFAPGDVFFVPAGAEHRFADFSSDFATWVIFIGPRP
jgi:mannose-6-phosphate isomerase-like protein (cupin superfamily)